MIDATALTAAHAMADRQPVACQSPDSATNGTESNTVKVHSNIAILSGVAVVASRAILLT